MKTFKNSCFRIEKHIEEIHESEALVADYLNIGYYTNFSDKYYITTVEGETVEEATSKYFVQIVNRYTAQIIGTYNAKTITEVKRVSIEMVHECVRANEKGLWN